MISSTSQQALANPMLTNKGVCSRLKYCEIFQQASIPGNRKYMEVELLGRLPHCRS